MCLVGARLACPNWLARSEFWCRAFFFHRVQRSSDLLGPYYSGSDLYSARCCPTECLLYCHQSCRGAEAIACFAALLHCKSTKDAHLCLVHRSLVVQPKVTSRSKKFSATLTKSSTFPVDKAHFSKCQANCTKISLGYQRSITDVEN
jgi:hypothetical protein